MAEMTMYDTVTPADLPADAQAIALYIDGRYAVTDDIWKAHPRALRCEIATDINTRRGTMLDCEPGNCTPAQVPYWVAHRLQAGVKLPVVYCSRSEWGEVASYVHASGLVAGYLIADWTGEPHDLPGTVGVQYANPPRLPQALQGRNLDVSVLTDATWLLPALGSPDAPVVPPEVPFPLPAGDWFGVPSPDAHNHSGYFWAGDRASIEQIQRKLGISPDGLYGPTTQAHVIGYQRVNEITVDGLVGPITWGKLF